MKKLFTFFAAVALLCAVGCGGDEYDDSALRKDLTDLANRVAKLEQLCQQMNTNISSLQTMVDVLQQKDYVTSVAPITQGGKVVGYTITFSRSGSITIYNGQDGDTPKIGVKKDTDGAYYWTIDGDWMVDSQGEKVSATPQLKIESGYWYISCDNGKSWQQLGKATGEDGDSFFQSVDITNDDYIVLVLANGTPIQLPRYQVLDIKFEKGDELAVMAGSTFKVNYTLIGGTINTHIATVTKNNWKVVVTKISDDKGYLTISAPNPLTDDAIVVFVSEGSRTIMRSLTFVDGITTIATKAYALSCEATTLGIDIHTNLDYIVKVPAEASGWISVKNITNRAILRNDVINLSIAENTATQGRMAELQLVCDDIEIGTISIYQQGVEVASNELVYTSSDGQIVEPYQTFGFSANIVSNTYLNGKGLIIFDKAITNIGEYAFYKCSTLTSVKMSKSIVNIREYAFSATSISNLSLPNSIVKIENYAFSNCTSLRNLVLPNSVTSIGDAAFKGCDLKDIVIPGGIQSIGISAFRDSSLQSVSIDSGVELIGNQAFSGCKNLKSIAIPNSVISIGASAFAYCESLRSVIIGNKVTAIGDYAFYGCKFLTSVYCSPVVPPTIGTAVFYNHYEQGSYYTNYSLIGCRIYVPVSNDQQVLNAYRMSSGWRVYAEDMEEYEF